MDSEKLYEVCYMQVYSYAMTLCRDSVLAEELTQETFLRAMSAGKASQFRENANVLTWLCAITKNLFADEMRRKKRFAPLTAEPSDEGRMESDAADKDTAYRIHKALHELDEPYKEVFQLRVFGELPFARIGTLFGKTENWARVTYHRARLKLSERMKDDDTKL